MILSLSAWSNHHDVSLRHHITSQNTCKFICGRWSCQKELCVNCHGTGEKALFCVIRMALPEARGSLSVKSINMNVCHWLCLCSNRWSFFVKLHCWWKEFQNASLVSRPSCESSCALLVRSLRSACHFWRPHILAGWPCSVSSGCAHCVTIVSTFLGQVSSWSAAPGTNPELMLGSNQTLNRISQKQPIFLILSHLNPLG